MIKNIYTFRFLLLSLVLLIFFSCSQGNDQQPKAGYGEVAASDDNSEFSEIFLDLDEMPDKESLSEKLQEKLDTAGLDPFFPNNRERRKLEDKLIGFYEEHDHNIMWTSSKGITNQGKQLIETINTIAEEGLNNDHYNVGQIKELFNQLNEDSGHDKAEILIELDFLFTSTYLVLASDLSSGRLNPHKFENRWIPSVPEKDLKDHLLEAFDSETIKESLLDLTPDHPQYQKLKEALAHYRNIEAEHQWHNIEIDSVLQKGDSGKIISKIKQRLHILGDLKNFNNNDEEAASFDENMELAVKSFQERHGLLADGILGQNTYEKLNIPLEEKITQIKLNIERLRWLPRDLGKEYIMVNVPEFKLRVYEKENVVDKMRVIVGKEFNSTPIFSDTLEYLSFSPTWTVPISILKDDFYDKLVADPGYLEKNHYELYPDWDQNSEPIDPFSIDWEEIDKETLNFRVVQKPGPWNALGQVKFMMPNNMAIYLHDTPTEHLFEEKDRDYSHGCVRVERPLDLSEFLLKEDASWNRQRIDQYLNLDEPEDVILPKKIPVHIVYKTTWIDENDKVHFFSDIYNHDEIQMVSLQKTLNAD